MISSRRRHTLDLSISDSAYGTLQSQISATAESTDSVDLPSQSSATAASRPAVKPVFELTEGGKVIGRH